MAVIRYDASSPIGEITLRRSESGGMRAYLCPSAQVSAEALCRAAQPLRTKSAAGSAERNWQFIPSDIHGRPALEVRGFGGANNLLEHLHKHGLISTPNAKIEPEAEDKLDWKEQIRKQALRISGLLYMTGDISFFLYGLFGKRKDGSQKTEEQVAAVAYATGSAALTWFSRDPSTQQIRDLSQFMHGELKKYGVEVAPDTALGRIADTRQLRLLDKTGNFLRKHNSDLMNASYAVSGAAQIVGATKDLNELNRQKLGGLGAEASKNGFYHTNSLIDVGVGAATSGSSLLTMAIREKGDTERAQHAKETNPLKRAVHWFTDQPMRISGYGLLSSTLLHSISSFRNLRMANRMLATSGIGADEREKYHADKKSFGFRMVFVVSNILAELIMTLGSKGHGAGVQSDDSIARSAASMAAEIIERQPPEARDYTEAVMANLLCEPRALGGKAEQYLPLLDAARATARTNPWLAPSFRAADAAPPSPPQITPPQATPPQTTPPHTVSETAQLPAKIKEITDGHDVAGQNKEAKDVPWSQREGIERKEPTDLRKEPAAPRYATQIASRPALAEALREAPASHAAGVETNRQDQAPILH